MRIEPVVSNVDLGNDRKLVAVYLPRFSKGNPFIILEEDYCNRHINLITDKSDLQSGNIKINRQSFDKETINEINFISGMVIEYEDHDAVDIFTSKSLV
jgi:hypothetical protein